MIKPPNEELRVSSKKVEGSENKHFSKNKHSKFQDQTDISKECFIRISVCDNHPLGLNINYLPDIYKI